MKKVSLIVCLLAVTACGKKGAAPDAAATGAATGAMGATGTTGATPPPVAAVPRNAAGGEVTAATVVTDCPKSLAGSEDVARTIKKECGPIPVTADYTIEGSLTLEAGASLKLADGASLVVGYGRPSKLIVKGTATDPVTLTASGDQVAGVWQGVRLHDGAARSSLEGLVIDFAGNDERGALWIGAKDVVVKGVTVRNGKTTGLVVTDEGSLAELSGCTFNKAGTVAVSVPASAVGGLSAGNTFDVDAVIDVREGKVEKDTKWQNPGAPYRVVGNVGVAGPTGRPTLEILAGTELRFADSTGLTVGYGTPGVLVVSGTAEKPVIFTSAASKEPGAWNGIYVYENGDARLTGAILENGGKDEGYGVLAVRDSAALSLKGSTIRNNLYGVMVRETAKLGEIDGNTFSGNTRTALSVFAQLAGKIGAANKLEDKQRFEIPGGKVMDSSTWSPLGGVLEVTDDVNVIARATLTLAPGLDLAFASGTELGVGYGDTGSLKAMSTADKPIRLHGITGDPGSWDGVIAYDGSRDVTMDNVVIEGAGGAGGLTLKLGATGKVSNLTCKKCAAAAVFKDCEVKVETSGIKNEDGTPDAEKKADGCQ